MSEPIRQITALEAANYEVESSWLLSTPLILFPCMVNVIGDYYAWKVNRKMARIARRHARWAKLKQETAIA